MKTREEVARRLKEYEIFLKAVEDDGPQHGLPSKVELETEVYILRGVLGLEKI